MKLHPEKLVIGDFGGHATQLLYYLHEQRKSGLCDSIIIGKGGESLPVHGCLLSAFGDVGTFNSGSQPTNTGKALLLDFDKAYIEIVLDLLYIGEATLKACDDRQECLRQIADCAAQLQISTICHLCKTIFKKHCDDQVLVMSPCKPASENLPEEHGDCRAYSSGTHKRKSSFPIKITQQDENAYDSDIDVPKIKGSALLEKSASDDDLLDFDFPTLYNGQAKRPWSPVELCSLDVPDASLAAMALEGACINQPIEVMDAIFLSDAPDFCLPSVGSCDFSAPLAHFYANQPPATDAPVILTPLSTHHPVQAEEDLLSAVTAATIDLGENGDATVTPNIQDHLSQQSDQLSQQSAEIHSQQSASWGTTTEKISCTCELCGKVLRDIYTLRLHKDRIHDNVKSHVCPLCSRAFTQRQHMRAHVQRQHHKEKPFKCEQCDAAYSCRYELTRHVQGHTERPGFVCEQCGEAFYHRQKLTVHRKFKHSGNAGDLQRRSDGSTRVRSRRRSSARRNDVASGGKSTDSAVGVVSEPSQLDGGYLTSPDAYTAQQSQVAESLGLFEDMSNQSIGHALFESIAHVDHVEPSLDLSPTGTFMPFSPSAITSTNTTGGSADYSVVAATTCSLSILPPIAATLSTNEFNACHLEQLDESTSHTDTSNIIEFITVSEDGLNTS